jgi:hypothetical protein
MPIPKFRWSRLSPGAFVATAGEIKLVVKSVALPMSPELFEWTLLNRRTGLPINARNGMKSTFDQAVAAAEQSAQGYLTSGY